MKQAIILASSSIYRRELMQRLQIPFHAVSPHVDETVLTGEKPQDTALRLSKEKAKKEVAAMQATCDKIQLLSDFLNLTKRGIIR